MFKKDNIQYMLVKGNRNEKYKYVKENNMLQEISDYTVDEALFESDLLDVINKKMFFYNRKNNQISTLDESTGEVIKKINLDKDTLSYPIKFSGDNKVYFVTKDNEVFMSEIIE